MQPMGAFPGKRLLKSQYLTLRSRVAKFMVFAGETTIRSRKVVTLDFDKPQGDATWSCRQYFVAERTLQYTLGFGTTDKVGMFDLYDRITKSFEILAEPDSL